MGFGYLPHKNTCDILSEDLVLHRFQACLSKNEGGVLGYTKGKIKTRHWNTNNLWLSSLWWKTGFNDRDIFVQYYFSLPLLHNILHHFYWKLHHLNCLPILEGDIIRITNYEYDQYFSIYAWWKLGVSCDAKVK